MNAFFSFTIQDLDFIAIPQSPEFFRIIDEHGYHYGTWSKIERFISSIEKNGIDSYRCGQTKILLK